MTPVEEIEAALRHIDSHDREQWVRMGAAIKTELGDTDGFDVWNAWSAEASNYNPRAAASTWRSLKAGFVNIGTLFYEARQNGYEPSQEYVPPTAAEIAERRRANEIAQQKAEEERKQQMAEAKIFAQKRYSSLEPIRELNHDYLVNKGIADHALLKQVRTDGNNLVIPLKIMGEIVGIQEINKSGRKTFNKGLELKGSSLVMGAWANRHKGIVLTEGYATAASIHKATGLTTVICFAGFNLAEVAKRFPKNLDVPIIIAADNDLPDRNGNIPGMQYAMAAKEVLGDKATIIEPSFTEQEFKEFESLYGSRPSDFNDLHKLHGLNAVKIQLQPTQEIEVEKKVAHLGSVSNRDQGVDLYITDDDRYLIEESFHALNGEQWGKETASKTYDTEEEVKEYLKNSPLGHSTETLNELYSKARFRQDSAQTIETNLKHEINMNENFNKSELTQIEQEFSVEKPEIEVEENSISPDVEKIFQQRMSEREKSNELDDIELETQHLKKPETESEIESTEQSQTPETEEVIDVEKELSKRIVLDHNYEPPYELKQKYVFTEKGDYINNNGDLFFKDHGAELKTVKTDIDTVRDMLAVAETKGWSSIDLKGTKEFKRLAFLEAESRGIKTTGYLPTERDMAILNQMIEERSRNKIQQSEKTPDSEQTANKERTLAEKEILQENGKLVKHGAAPYQFDEKEKPNYYVEVEMPDGKIERYWGVDLERAIEEAQAEIGHEIELQNLGRQPVTVSKNIYDDKGNFQRVEEIETHRNKWEITNHSLEKEASEKELDIGQQQAEKDKAINQNRATAEAVIEDSARVDAHGADIPMRGVGGQEIQDEVLAFMNGLTPKQKGLNKSGLFKLRMHKELLKPIISGLNSKQRDQAIRNFNETMDKSINGQDLNYPPTRTQERSTPTHTPAPTQTRVAEREPELER